MELRDLRTFLAVVRAGSFTAAATELGYTQSAVSQQIAALERELGHRLLDRRPVGATPAGERLAEHASRILQRVDVATAELVRLESREGPLRVDCCPLAGPGLLATALRELRAAEPTVAVTVRSVDAPTATADVVSGRADVALIDGITAPDSPLAFADAGLLTAVGLVEVPLVVVLPAGHPFSTRPAIDLDVLVDAPWISAAALTGRIEGIPTGRGGVVYEGSDVSTLLSLVAAGLGVALFPAAASAVLPAASPAHGVAAVPLRRPCLVHRTELLALRTSRAAGRLVEALRSRATLR